MKKYGTGCFSMILYHHPALWAPVGVCKGKLFSKVQLRCNTYVTTPAFGHPLGASPLSQRYSFAVILTSLPRPSATPSNRRGIRRGIKRSCKAMLRCCVRGPGRRLGGAGLCGCTYRRLDFLPTFSSRKKLEKKKSERIFAYFPSVESVKKIVDINLF